MQQHRIAKEYLAVVWGWPEWDDTKVDSPLAGQGAHQPSLIWLKQMIHADGARAVTKFRVENVSFGKQTPEKNLASSVQLR